MAGFIFAAVMFSHKVKIENANAKPRKGLLICFEP
jgi:hypothetical protein